MKVLITGSTGQLGKYLIKNKPKGIDLLSPNRLNLDLRNIDMCKEFIKSNKPDFIINAGAYTNVEKAETNKEETFLINTKSVEVFVQEIKKYNGRFLQISSDYVFNGNFLRSSLYFSIGYDSIDGADGGCIRGGACFKQGCDTW